MKTVTLPDFGDSGSLYQQVEVPEPGDPGYTGARLPESDPWATHVNPVMDAAEGYVTEISVPNFGDGGVQRIRSHFLQPEGEPEPEA